MPSKGILYAATNQDRYVEEAFLSAESLRRLNPGLPITLFTDRADHPLCGSGVFDSVIPIRGETGFSSAWAQGQLNRLKCLARTPYEHTLHLDTDTRILTNNVSELFDILDAYDVGMVETAEDASYSRRHYGQPMFSAGFIVYRRNARTEKWLAAWVATSGRNFKMADSTPLPPVDVIAHIASEDVRRNLLRMDQTSLVEILNPQANAFDLKVHPFGYAWNFADSRLPENNREPIKILHTTRLKKTTHHDILSVAYAWDGAGRHAEADKLYAYIAGKQRLPRRGRGWQFWQRARPPEEWATASLRNADIHVRHGQLDKAAKIFGDLIEADAADVYALAGYARVAVLLKRMTEAVDLAAAALALAPRSPYVQTVQGTVLNAAGRARDAVVSLTPAANARSPGAAFQLGQSWMALADYPQAAQAFRRELESDREHHGAANNLMPALLGARQYEAALEAADTLLRDRRWHVPALAFKSVALAELGRAAALSALVDQSLVKGEAIAPPGMSVSDFNRNLARAFAAEKTLKFAPPAHATRQGWHSEDLSESASASVRTLNELIRECVKRRMAEGQHSGHPFFEACPQTYRLYAWTVVMEKGGHQIPHIHGLSWLSGVYYVEVPNDVQDSDPEQKGWLSFGRAEERWHRPETQTPDLNICPQPGMLVTFPSYFWHGTRPITTSRRRISYAFDIIPT